MASVSVCVHGSHFQTASATFQKRQLYAGSNYAATSPSSVGPARTLFKTVCRDGRRFILKASLDSEVTEADDKSKAGPELRLEDGGLATELSKAVRKTAVTFAPGASKKQKNPAVPGSTLYKVFEVQAYLGLGLGALLSYNILFPSSEPDIWRLMGMWSVWMFTIPSLRARDCSAQEKEALNYLFLVVPLINITLPLLWKSFAAVYTADVTAFLIMYAWKVGSL